MSDAASGEAPADLDVPSPEDIARWRRGLAIGGGALALGAFLTVHPWWKGPCIDGAWVKACYGLGGVGAFAALGSPWLSGWIARRPAWRENVYSLALAFLLALVIRTFIVQAFKIPSGSMLPTLQIGDHILVVKFSYGTRIPFTDHVIQALGLRDPQRGDIVVFRFPQNECEDYIKRIIGLPGDTIEVRNRRVFVNGEPLRDEWGRCPDGKLISDPESDCGPPAARVDNAAPFHVPEDSYFMMGDNRQHSQDSRFWGTVERDKILGRAFWIYWSWDSERHMPRLGRLGRTVH
ncbi:MAG: signal peptidase I [bacterium]